MLRQIKYGMKVGFLVSPLVDGEISAKNVSSRGATVIRGSLPIACAASNAWYLGSWDRFMIPKPFTKVVVAIGEVGNVSAEQSSKDLSPVQNQMEQAINSLMEKAKQAL